jgi:hypothetical protein
MSLPGNLYEQAFVNHPKPKETVALLSARLRSSENVALALADFVEQRAAAEQAYVKALTKLTTKTLLPNDAGSLEEIWTEMEGELHTTIKSHSAFASKLENTIAAPLRERSRAGEQRVKQYSGDAQAIASDHDSISSKLAKASSKTGFGTSSKKQAQLASTQDDLSSTLASWLSTAPNYLKAVQSADKARLEAIKENLAKYETLVSDLGREKMEAGELASNWLGDRANLQLYSGIRAPIHSGLGTRERHAKLRPQRGRPLTDSLQQPYSKPDYEPYQPYASTTSFPSRHPSRLCFFLPATSLVHSLRPLRAPRLLFRQARRLPLHLLLQAQALFEPKSLLFVWQHRCAFCSIFTPSNAFAFAARDRFNNGRDASYLQASFTGWGTGTRRRQQPDSRRVQHAYAHQSVPRSERETARKHARQTPRKLVAVRSGSTAVNR